MQYSFACIPPSLPLSTLYPLNWHLGDYVHFLLSQSLLVFAAGYFNFHSFSITYYCSSSANSPSSSSSFVAVAWFTFDPVLSGGAGSGLIFSKNNATVSVEGWEHRVALGSVGFSRGVHYWEFTIDNYTADTDPAFGVARIDVARNKMLGKYGEKWVG